MPTIEIFCCYARKDQQLLNDLKTHLMPMQRSGAIRIWADTDIDAGEEWEKKIEKHLNTAQIILFLISPDFIASEYCYGKEMERAMERQKAGEALVLPIILRSVLWEATPFGRLQALPTGAKPVTSALWHNQDEALLDVTEGVRKAVLEMQKKTQPENQPLGNVPQITSFQQFQASRKIEENGVVSGKKPRKMSDKVKVASISATIVVIVAIIGGISLLHITTLTLMATPTSTVTPNNAVIPTAVVKPISAVTPTSTATPTNVVKPTTSPSVPVLAQSGTPFLSDPMTSPNNEDQWDRIVQSYVSCDFSNGGYDLKVPGHQSVGGCSTNASATILTNFIYEIDMTIVSGVTNDTSPTRGAGVMFRYDNQDGASNYGVSFQQDGTYYMFTYNKGVPGVSLGAGHCTSFHQGKNQTNRIDVEMQGSTITLFVNNAYVMTKKDNQFQSGQLGVQIGSGNDPSEVIYRNLKVWKL